MKTAEDIIKEKARDIISVPQNTIIANALKLMNEKNIGAILVTDGENYVGIWTERDLLRNTISEGFDPKKAVIKDYMSTGLQSAPHTATIYQLKDKFLGKRLRHLLVEKEGKFIGLLSTGDVIRASLAAKTKELEELNAMVSWEYYENWRWTSKD